MIRPLPFLSVLATGFVLTASAASADMPEHVRGALNKLVGDWQVNTTMGEDKSEWELTCKWSPTKDALVYSWKGTDFITKKQNTGTGFIGWDATKQMAVEFEVEGNGTVFSATHYISKQGEWTSPSKSTAMTDDGPVYAEVQRTFDFEDDDTLVIHGRNRILSGEKGPDEKSVFKRK